MSYTLTQREFSNLKSRLTRAKNRKEPLLIFQEVERAVEVFNEKGWPDNWATWRIALDDAASLLRVEGNYDAAAKVEARSWELFT